MGIKQKFRKAQTMATNWFIYIIRTNAGSLYTGITTDIERRFQEHSTGKKGAKSLRGKGPLELVFRKTAVDRSEASRLEARIKKLSRGDKEKLVAGKLSLLSDIST